MGGVNLTSSAGKMTMGIINNFAQFEHDLLIERTQSELARAKLEGKILGRPSALTQSQREKNIEQLQSSVSVSSIARQF